MCEGATTGVAAGAGGPATPNDGPLQSRSYEGPAINLGASEYTALVDVADYQIWSD